MKFNTVYGPIARRTRGRRMAHFEATLAPTQATRILDVGGYSFNWTLITTSPQVVLLNLIMPKHWPSRAVDCSYMVGDGRSLTFDDQSFDIAFSNSVIEHVGSWQDQKDFAAEIQRVGRSVWVQTPAKAFPFEPHFFTFFVHWLPRKVRKPLLRWLSLRRLLGLNAQECDQLADEVRLLTFAEMRTLFKDCEIYTERFCGLPRSYIAVRNGAEH